MTTATKTANTARPALARLCDCTDCGRQQPATDCADCRGTGSTRPRVRAVVRLVVRG